MITAITKSRSKIVIGLTADDIEVSDAFKPTWLG